jgi:hypothetical protein
VTVVEEASVIQTVLKALEANRFHTAFARDREDAKRIIVDIVPPGGTVGLGDSATIKQVGVIDPLKKRTKEVVNPYVAELTMDPTQWDRFQETKLKSVRCDVFLTSTNAVTIDGKLVNIDGAGNRVAGMIFGSKKVIVVAGRNKIVPNVDQALKRIKHVIAPVHAKHKRMRVPCATGGECVDCSSKERLCNITAIMEKQPHGADITVVLVDEDLGLGWDVSWPQDRKERIESRYGEVTWEFNTPWHPKKGTEKKLAQP